MVYIALNYSDSIFSVWGSKSLKKIVKEISAYWLDVTAVVLHSAAGAVFSKVARTPPELPTEV